MGDDVTEASERSSLDSEIRVINLLFALRPDWRDRFLRSESDSTPNAWHKYPYMAAEYIGQMIAAAQKDDDASSIIPVLNAIEAIAASDDLNAIDMIEAGLIEGIIQYADEFSIDTSRLYQQLGDQSRQQWDWIRNVWLRGKSSIAPDERKPPHRRFPK